MNWEHLRAFMWLRRRIFLNRMKKGGLGNVVILSILAAIAALIVLFLLVGFFFLGLFAMADASPTVVLYVWDGVVVGFLFLWLIGVMTDLQRSEVLSLDKFMHLPVSLGGAFVVNYLSSLPSLTMMVFFPAMLGLGLGLVFAKGPAFLLFLPLLAAFLFMVTALTYQFQGWLAALMANKRRRQTIIVLVTTSIILIGNAPNLINVFRPWGNSGQKERLAKHQEELTKINHALAAGEITAAQQKEKATRLKEEFEADAKERGRREAETWNYYGHIANVVFPPGWLPLGASHLADRQPIPALLGMLGLAAIGGASFWRAYRTTVRFYSGAYSAEKKPAVAAVAKKPQIAAPALFFERRLPLLSEPATAIALTTFRSLLRAPEAKMLLLSPIIMVVLFGGMFLARAGHLDDYARPLLPFAGMAVVLMGFVGLAANQFGFDRGGFRTYVLSPAPRRDILLGKNLALAPLTLGLGALVAVVLAIAYPLRWDHLLAVPFQLVTMYAIFCLLGNSQSILCPIAVATGLRKTAQFKGLAILLGLAFMIVFPISMLPALLPYGVEMEINHLGYVMDFPISLVLMIAECAGIIALYRFTLGWQGQWLRSQERKMLQQVTIKVD